MSITGEFRRAPSVPRVIKKHRSLLAVQRDKRRPVAGLRQVDTSSVTAATAPRFRGSPAAPSPQGSGRKSFCGYD